MAEKVMSGDKPTRRFTISKWICTACGLLTFGLCVLTGYLIWPRYVVSRGLEFETYADGTALEFVDSVPASWALCGIDGPLFYGPGRRFCGLCAYDMDGFVPGPLFWIIVDTQKERVLGSFRLLRPEQSVYGISSKSATQEVIDDHSETFALDLICYVQLPRWWPMRGLWGEKGIFQRSVRVEFDATQCQWTSFVAFGSLEDSANYAAHSDSAGDVMWPTLRGWGDWKRRPVKHSPEAYPIPDTDDELVLRYKATEIGDRNDLRYVQFQELLRRRIETGEVRWCIGPDAVPSLGIEMEGFAIDLDISFSNMDHGTDWCWLRQLSPPVFSHPAGFISLHDQWLKLDLDTGALTAHKVPEFYIVASDGQTLLSRYESSDGLNAWHPGRGAFHVAEPDGVSYDITVLPRRRLLAYTTTFGTQPKIKVLSLDDLNSHQLYP